MKEAGLAKKKALPVEESGSAVGEVASGVRPGVGR
jgi:hypothetical protein